MNLGEPALKKRVSLEFRLNAFSARNTQHKNEFSYFNKKCAVPTLKMKYFTMCRGLLNSENIFFYSSSNSRISGCKLCIIFFASNFKYIFTLHRCKVVYRLALTVRDITNCWVKHPTQLSAANKIFSSAHI